MKILKVKLIILICYSGEGTFKITLEVFKEEDIAMIGIIALIIISIISISGILYKNHRSWHIGRKIKQGIKGYSDSRYVKKEKERLRKEREANKFENLLRSAKGLIKSGKQKFTKKLFKEAVEKWKEAEINQEKALKTAPTPKQKSILMSKMKTLRKSICNAYIGEAMKHDIDAKKAHDGTRILESEEEWNTSKINYNAALDLIKTHNLEIPYEIVKRKLDVINSNLRVCSKITSLLFLS